MDGMNPEGMAERGASRMADAMNSMKEAAQEKVEQGRAKVRELQKSLETSVQEQPLKAVLIALGVGVLVGLILKRR
jgi:ElaB/YqjD/DUF883 family membrane-anchored ribosome-binding protein